MVFEHQRELALSLIERLPISASGTNVAVGIISFTAVPTVRLPLGLGREKAIEAIRTVSTQPSYADAVSLALAKIHNEGRADARAGLVILGNGNSKDSEAAKIAMASQIRKSGETRERVHAAAGVEVQEGVYSTPASLRSDVALQRDVLGEPLNVDKINEEKDSPAYQLDSTDGGNHKNNYRPRHNHHCFYVR
ncbi:hypothetical protein TELCIR_13317 [Teladorsagia circumcincta]|uniref:VWFA domain-containing protein n=1 Tax=Teladorsagia circumcincta TaxID=45464 RepID=A0A2G9U432_TELCI|nr:hypothetical protein TELCIR_13317 [Teladorsagia circumcincta]